MSTFVPKLNLLVAYPYMTRTVINLISENQQRIRFLLDSGAFTAAQQGKTIALDDYCRFLESLPFKPWRYFTLDVIGDADKTLKNYETMLNRGFKPIPVLTKGESLSVMDDFYKTSDVVGIGGLVNQPLNEKIRFISKVMAHANGRRVHWLGFTNDKCVKHFRPYMCDSSVFANTGRYGALNIYMGNGKVKGFTKADFSRKPSPDVLNKIYSYGISPYDLAKIQNWHGGKALSRKLSACSYVDKSCDYEKNIKVKVFLASAAEDDTENLVYAINQKLDHHDQQNY